MPTKPAMKKAPKKSFDFEGLKKFAKAADKEPEDSSVDQEPETEPADQEPERNPDETITDEKEKKKVLPWEEGVSEKIPKPFNLRTNQVQIEKLKYIVENITGFKSVHAFCMDAVEKRMDEELEKLMGDNPK